MWIKKKEIEQLSEFVKGYSSGEELDIRVNKEGSFNILKNDIYALAFDVEMSTGIELSPIIKNEKQYEYWVDTLPFYRNVRNEGGNQ